MTQSPASQFEQGLALIESALRQLKVSGHAADALGDAAVAAYHLRGALDELPDRLCSGETPHCEGCQFAHRAISYESLGDRQLTREWTECAAPRATACPAVNAAGWGDPERPETCVPHFLRRQAI